PAAEPRLRGWLRAAGLRRQFRAGSRRSVSCDAGAPRPAVALTTRTRVQDSGCAHQAMASPRNDTQYVERDTPVPAAGGTQDRPLTGIRGKLLLKRGHHMAEPANPEP